MASMSDIKRRIVSIESTQQITKAMKLVSTAKLQKAKNQVEGVKPYFEKIRETIASILQASTNVSHPYMEEREVQASGYIVLTSDRGLAGGYNSNICKLVARHAQSTDSTKIILPVGKKGRDYFSKRSYKVTEEIASIDENPSYYDAVAIGKKILALFEEEKVDEVYLAYTAFHSTIQHESKLIKLLPVDEGNFGDIEVPKREEMMNYEPSPGTVLGDVIPKYIYSIIYGGLVESTASEHGARMTAMDSATNNAQEMISDLTLVYNRARQASITQEISEIVGGAEALK